MLTTEAMAMAHSGVLLSPSARKMAAHRLKATVKGMPQ